MATINTIIERVNPRDVNTQRGPSVVYDVYLGDGTKAATFDSDLGRKAQSLVGRMVRVELTSKQKGEYTNVYLDSVESADMSADGAYDAPTPATTPQMYEGTTTHDQQQATAQDATAARIARTSALKMAIDVGIAAGLPGQVSWEDVEAWADYILTAQRVPF